MKNRLTHAICFVFVLLRARVFPKLEKVESSTNSYVTRQFLIRFTDRILPEPGFSCERLFVTRLLIARIERSQLQTIVIYIVHWETGLILSRFGFQCRRYGRRMYFSSRLYLESTCLQHFVYALIQLCQAAA